MPASFIESIDKLIISQKVYQVIIWRSWDAFGVFQGTCHPGKGHKIYPYLLKGLTIDRPNQVFCTDITYVPMSKGFVYLVAIMDWHSRKILTWRLSNIMDTDFCIDALEEAIKHYGAPEIFNTD